MSYGNFNRQLGDIDQQLRQMNARARRQEQRSRNGGYTDGEVLLGQVVRGFRRMGVVGRVVTIVIVLAVAWMLFGTGIMEVIHQARGQ